MEMIDVLDKDGNKTGIVKTKKDVYESGDYHKTVHIWIINDNNEWECPNCGNKDHSKMNVVRRTCGYLGENFWNAGKTKEIKQRVLHM